MTSRSLEETIAQAMAVDGVASDEVRHALHAYSLLDVCKSIKEFLCDVSKVQPAMRLLASAAVGRDTLNKSDVQLLFVFFAEKLSQVECQTAALGSLALLISDVGEKYSCSADWFHIVALPFAKSVRVQQLPLNCRRQCFCIMTYLFTDATLPLCDSDTLNSLLEMMDGESDPELVVRTFDLHVIAATCATKAAFAPVLDDYFDSISSYFPVVFSQPPGCRVTKAELRTCLKRCLCLSVYSECCISFMQGKLASPSIAVKEDVLDVLLTCFETYRAGALNPYFGSLVTHMKNEVVKLSSFADRSSNPTLTKCVCMSCEVLGQISKSCSVRTQAEALEVFGPVVEGFLSALSADTSVCSAYATMVFHVLAGSWDCCIYVSAYLFSMLSMSLDEETERLANAHILFAALTAGMLDALLSFPAPEHVESMRRGTERSTPQVAEAVRRCASRWTLPVSSANGDDFSVVCGCEFVIAVLKLSLSLQPWLSYEVRDNGLDALVWAALFRSTEVSAKVCKLLRDYAEADGDGLRAAVLRLLTKPVAPAERGLVVVCEMATTSSEALLLAYEHGFLSPACVWMSTIPAEQKARALEKALEHFGDALRDATAERMTAVLCRDDVAPDYFNCACFVAANLSSGECQRLLDDEKERVSLLGVAAFLASRPGLQVTQPRWANATVELKALAVRDVAAWRRVGMEGITGAVVNHIAATTTAEENKSLLVAVADLWGHLLAEGKSEERDASRHGAVLVSSFAQEFLVGDTLASDATSAVKEAFTYLPFRARQTSSRLSLLQLLLAPSLPSRAATTSLSRHTNTVFCTALQHLAASETSRRVRGCLPELLSVITDLAGRHKADKCGERETQLARELLFTTEAKCGNSPALARAVLGNEALLCALLKGAAEGPLSSRCRSLHLVTALARGAASMMAQDAPDEKATLASVRDRVLAATKHSLGDHKRKVRQEAAACRHEWYKVK